MRICVIRHGETDWNKAGRVQGREDIPLNARGRRQAAAVAEVLAQTRWDIIVSSPLRRASQTAEILAERLGIAEVDKDPCFLERDYGKASGLTEAQRTARYPNRQYEGMESWEALRSRVMDGLNRYTKEYNGQSLVIVSHGGSINAMLSTISGGEIGSGKTRLLNACINMLSYKDGRYRIEYYNQSAQHLLHR